MAPLKTALLVCSLVAAASALPHPQKSGPFLSNLIVGGQPATQGELPYQMDLRAFDSATCGGSLVIVNGKQVVVTAAHCVDWWYPSEYFTVVAGELSQSQNSGLEQVRQVTKIVVHEDYGVFGYENDIALLFLNQPFNLNADVAPIQLPFQGQQTTGDVLISGWGTLASNGLIPDILQKVKLPLVSDSECAAAYSDEYFVKESMLCAGLSEGGQDSCQGDSGGPVKALNGDYLAGIVSWGYGCAEPGYPGVNTEVAYFVDWIESKV